MVKTPYKLSTIYPIHVKDYGIGDAALKITENMGSEHLETVFYCPASNIATHSVIKRDLFPSLIKHIYYRILPSSLRKSLAEFLFLWRTKSSDIIYIWPGVSLNLVKKIKERGQILICENINCHQQTARDILWSEYDKLNLPRPLSISDDDIILENKILGHCDFIFSPSPQVTESLLNNGIMRKDIIEVSYGLKSHERTGGAIRSKNPTDPFTALFVGRVGVRKGVHLLLEYWKDAKLDATLKIVGIIEPEFETIAERYRDTPNIEFINFTENLAALYDQADIFVIPSLEEGSPLVTYQAIGAGLPCLVSPMGGKGVIRDKTDGYIIDPHQSQQWIEAIYQLHNNTVLRQRMSQAAYQNSEQFLWKNVGNSRSNKLIEKLNEANS